MCLRAVFQLVNGRVLLTGKMCTNFSRHFFHNYFWLLNKIACRNIVYKISVAGKDNIAVTLSVHIAEMLGSNLGWDIGYRDRFFRPFPVATEMHKYRSRISLCSPHRLADYLQIYQISVILPLNQTLTSCWERNDSVQFLFTYAQTWQPRGTYRVSKVTNNIIKTGEFI